jgi:hypothetical protein
MIAKLIGVLLTLLILFGLALLIIPAIGILVGLALQAS